MITGPATLASRIERRLLVTTRLDADAARALLPPALEPDLVDGSAVAGVCLIRLGRTRPTWAPGAVGWGAENVAHRVAVRWRDGGAWRHGVYIPRRHSASRLAVAVGGRLFPGAHRAARFAVAEDADRVHLRIDADDLRLEVRAEATGSWTSSLFPTPGDASEFYRRGAVGLSPSRDGRRLEAVTLSAPGWHARPAVVRSLRSDVLEGMGAGVQVDSALLMQDIDVVWHRGPDVPLATSTAPARL